VAPIITEQAAAAINNLTQRYGGSDQLNTFILWIVEQTASRCPNKLAPVLLGFLGRTDASVYNTLLEADLPTAGHGALTVLGLAHLRTNLKQLEMSW